MMDKNAYIEAGGGQCPFCGNETVEGGFVEIEHGQACQKMGCTDCEGSWHDVYRLVDLVLP